MNFYLHRTPGKVTITTVPSSSDMAMRMFQHRLGNGAPWRQRLDRVDEEIRGEATDGFAFFHDRSSVLPLINR